MTAVGVLVDLPATLVLETVVMPTQTLQVVRDRAPTSGERDTMIEIGELGRPIAAGEPASAIPQPDIPIQRSRRRVLIRITVRRLVGDPNVEPAGALPRQLAPGPHIDS